MHAAGNLSRGRYRYTGDLLALQAALPSAVALSPDCTAVTSPLKPRIWESYLSTHPDRQFVQWLVDGIQEGFHVGCCANLDVLRSATRNMPAADLHPVVIEKYLSDELAGSRLVEIPTTLSNKVHVSKFGVIPKKHQPGKWRLIVDLSSPDGASVNDFIDPALCSLSYATVEDAAAFVFKAGRGALLAKLDIKAAYRNIPVHPGDRYLLGMQWHGRTFVDTCLPFGLRSAPKIFNATADALEWIIADQGRGTLEFILHYLDDFLFGGSPHSDSCGKSLNLALHICSEVGFPVMAEKVKGPSTVIDFLGFLIDTMAMEIRLPEEKLERLKTLIRSWWLRRSCTKRELLSLVGNLQHASAVVKPGRTFLRRMIDLSKRQVHLDAHLRLNTEFRADLCWWATYLETWNGVSVVSALCYRPINATLTTDASGSWGCGAFFGSRWFSLSWESCPCWAEVHISVKELLPIVVSCAIWGRQMAGSHIRCLCDNAAVVVMVNKRTTSLPLAMHLLRCLFFICAKFDITLSARHLAGHKNKAADALSRDDVQSFFKEVTYAQNTPSPVPSDLIDILMNQKPNWLSAEWSRSFKDCL